MRGAPDLSRPQPENVLFTADWRLVIADFGVSINLNEERAVTRAGTLEYMVSGALGRATCCAPCLGLVGAGQGWVLWPLPYGPSLMLRCAL